MPRPARRLLITGTTDYPLGGQRFARRGDHDEQALRTGGRSVIAGGIDGAGRGGSSGGGVDEFVVLKSPALLPPMTTEENDWRVFLLHDIAATNSLEPIGVGHYQSV
jgi:hypothetical protein